MTVRVAGFGLQDPLCQFLCTWLQQFQPIIILYHALKEKNSLIHFKGCDRVKEKRERST